MRSRKMLLALGLLAMIVSSLVVIGCSGDDRPTVPDPVINDQYQFVVDEVNSTVEQSISLMATTLNVFELASDVTDSTVIAEIKESSLNFDDVIADGDWYVMTTTDGLMTSLSSIWTERVLFTADGVPQRFSGAADGMLVQHLWEQASTNTEDSYSSYLQDGELTYSGMNTEQAFVSGSMLTNGTVQVVIEGTTTISTFTIDADLNGLVIDKSPVGWVDGCPVSGTVTATVTLSYQVDEITAVETSWDLTLTFEDGAVTAAVSDGTVDAQYANSFCTP